MSSGALRIVVCPENCNLLKISFVQFQWLLVIITVHGAGLANLETSGLRMPPVHLPTDCNSYSAEVRNLILTLQSLRFRPNQFRITTRKNDLKIWVASINVIYYHVFLFIFTVIIFWAAWHCVFSWIWRVKVMRYHDICLYFFFQEFSILPS